MEFEKDLRLRVAEVVRFELGHEFSGLVLRDRLKQLLPHLLKAVQLAGQLEDGERLVRELLGVYVLLVAIVFGGVA